MILGKKDEGEVSEDDWVDLSDNETPNNQDLKIKN